VILLGFLSTVIGVLLGLLGGGGSILTVPVLLYLTDLSTKSAIITSLVVVCLTSMIASIRYAKKGKVCWKTGFTFSTSGMPGAYFGGQISAYIPDSILIVMFALIMLLTSTAMIKSKTIQPTDKPLIKNLCPVNLPVSAILFDGLLVGLVTGLIGVGGGFLLVPALTILAGLPIQAAVGTSLFIIVMQSIAALAGHLNQMSIDLNLTLMVAVCAILGSIVGSGLANKMDAQLLKQGFGVFVLLLGCFILYQEVNQSLVLQLKQLITQHQEFLKGTVSIIILLYLYRIWSKLHSF